MAIFDWSVPIGAIGGVEHRMHDREHEPALWFEEMRNRLEQRIDFDHIHDHHITDGGIERTAGDGGELFSIRCIELGISDPSGEIRPRFGALASQINELRTQFCGRDTRAQLAMRREN